jgi:hypothetical protein
MNKNQTDKSNQKTESMSKQKTNEDFNKQKPNPNDPNQNKNHQAEGDPENKKRISTPTAVDMKKDSQNGNKGKVDFSESKQASH